MRKYDYQNSIGFIVKCAAKAFDSAYDQQLRKNADITVAQSRVISVLALVKNGMTQKEIANKIGIEAPTIVPIIDRLEEQQIVVRRSDDNDRRNNLIFLAGKSEEKWELIVGCALELEKASHEGSSEEEIEITKKTLRRIAQNVTGFNQISSDQTESRGGGGRAVEGGKNSNSIQLSKRQLLHHGERSRI